MERGKRKREVGKFCRNIVDTYLRADKNSCRCWIVQKQCFCIPVSGPHLVQIYNEAHQQRLARLLLERNKKASQEKSHEQEGNSCISQSIRRIVMRSKGTFATAKNLEHSFSHTHTISSTITTLRQGLYIVCSHDSAPCCVADYILKYNMLEWYICGLYLRNRVLFHNCRL